MKKMFLKSAVLAIAGVGLMAGSTMAISLSDDQLQTFFDSKGWGIDAGADQMSNVSAWNLTTASSAIGASFWLENPGEYSFGIYSTAGQEMATIFDGADTPVASAQIGFLASNAIVVQWLDNNGLTISSDTYSFTGTTFGFFSSDASGLTIYSDKFLNDLDNNGIKGEDADIGMLVYNAAPGSYVFASDMDGTGSFSNMVTQAESVAPVPEPATMLLFGTGLAGLAGVARRKKVKES